VPNEIEFSSKEKIHFLGLFFKKSGNRSSEYFALNLYSKNNTTASKIFSSLDSSNKIKHNVLKKKEMKTKSKYPVDSSFTNTVLSNSVYNEEGQFFTIQVDKSYFGVIVDNKTVNFYNPIDDESGSRLNFGSIYLVYEDNNYYLMFTTNPKGIETDYIVYRELGKISSIKDASNIAKINNPNKYYTKIRTDIIPDNRSLLDTTIYSFHPIYWDSSYYEYTGNYKVVNDTVVKHGWGKKVWYDQKDTVSYIGYWKNDSMDGRGTMIFSESSKTMMFTGYWKNNKRNGKGIEIKNINKMETEEISYKIKGIWQDGKPKTNMRGFDKDNKRVKD
jgi:hypothetical protein